MKLEEISCCNEGFQQPGRSEIRLWVAFRSVDGRNEVEYLHDPEWTGTLARVFRAMLKTGGQSQDVAVKLRRDSPLNVVVHPETVAEKFDAEYSNHRSLNAAGDEPPSAIVRLIEHRPNPSSCWRADVIPPCLLCSRARHALALRSPLENGGIELKEANPNGIQRRLKMEGETEELFWTDQGSQREDIIHATLGNDESACQGCQHQGRGPEACLPFLVLENFFENQFLLFEKMATDLDGYLKDQNSRQTSEDPRTRLMEKASLSLDILKGVELLHGRGMVHLDLNPENICLDSMSHPRRACIIDLGMALAKNDVERPAWRSEWLWPRRGGFAAWECRHPDNDEPLEINARWQGDRELAFELNRNEMELSDYDPPLCAGDFLFAKCGPDQKPRAWRVLGIAPGNSVTSGRLSLDIPPDERIFFKDGKNYLFNVFKRRGQTADIFSLGMVLWSLLMDFHRGEGLRRMIDKLQNTFIKIVEDAVAMGRLVEDWTPLQLAEKLLSHHYSLEENARTFLYKHLETFGLMTGPALEWLGIAWAAILRHPHLPGLLLPNRSGDAAAALSRMKRQMSSLLRSLGQWDAAKPAYPLPTVQRPREMADDLKTLWRFFHYIPMDGSLQRKLLDNPVPLDQGVTPIHSLREDLWDLLKAADRLDELADLLHTEFHKDAHPVAKKSFFARIKDFFFVKRRFMPKTWNEATARASDAIQTLELLRGNAKAWIYARKGEYDLAKQKWIEARDSWEKVWLEDLIAHSQSFWDSQWGPAFDTWNHSFKETLSGIRDWMKRIMAGSDGHIRGNQISPEGAAWFALLAEETSGHKNQIALFRTLLLGPAGDMEADFHFRERRANMSVPRPASGK